jgi:uroporphyrinogen-III synthase
MTRTVIAIRPEPGSSATVARGSEAGLAIAAFPLFEVRPVAWEPPSPETIDGLLLGSANAVRMAGPGLAAFLEKPVHAVGEMTAAAARAAGLPVAATGRGTLQPLLETVSPPRTLLRLAGEEHVPLSPPAGVAVETRIVYRSVPLPLPAAAAGELRGGALVLLHSGAAARHFAAECGRLGIRRSAVALAALAPRVAEAAGDGWSEVRCADEPREAALLALASDMCHEPPPGSEPSG